MIFSNVVARLRRTSRSFEEASADLGASTCRRSASSRCRRCAAIPVYFAHHLTQDKVVAATPATEAVR